jgi:hypothetical protein
MGVVQQRPRSGDRARPRHRSVDRRLAICLGATVVIVLAGVTAQFIDYAAYGLRIDALNSNDDGGIFGAVGDAALVAAAIAAAVRLAGPRPRRAASVALPVLLAFLALDKIARLHDHVPHWPVAYGPILALTFIALVAVARPAPLATRRLVAAGLVLLTASLVLHFFGEAVLNRLGASPAGWAYQIKATTKHGAEVAGWLVVALGLATGARERDRDR